MSTQNLQDKMSSQSLLEGWRIEPVQVDSVQGYLIGSPRTPTGVRSNTVVFADSPGPAERLLFLLIHSELRK